MIAIDIETHDPNLSKLGPGDRRKDGRITCICTYDGTSAKSYRPDDPQLQTLFKTNELKVLHNAVYDLSWLQSWGVPVHGPFADTRTRDALIYEYSDSYTLDACCKRRGVTGKSYDALQEWWKAQGNKDAAINHMDTIPFIVQAEYCMQDCRATWSLYNKQTALMSDLQEIDHLESRLIPVLIEMRKNGVRIDIRERNVMRSDLCVQLMELRGQAVEDGLPNVGSNKQLTEYFNAKGIRSKVKTGTGAQSWNAKALKQIGGEAGSILKIKELEKLYGTYMEGHFTRDLVGDRIHGVFLPTRTEEGGTVSGRFSSSHPNLQNIPSDSKKQGHFLRKLFIPDEGCIMGAFDYKQIEFRLFSHYAIAQHAPGWKQLRDEMAKGSDYHAYVGSILGWGPEQRKMTKQFNFGVLYGMGVDKMVMMYEDVFVPPAGMPVLQYAYQKREEYFNKLPFIKKVCTKIKQTGEMQGYIKTYAGRVCRLKDKDKGYVLVNRLIQGGAADLAKQGLIEAYEDGVFDVIKLHFPIHDENLISIPKTKEGREAAEHFVGNMITKRQFNVPIGVDTEVGPNWLDVGMEGWNEWKY